MLLFCALIESGILEPEKVYGTPLCMGFYKWLFHASCCLTLPSDPAHKFSPAQHNHFAVLHKNHFFIVPLIHPSSGTELEVQLTHIHDMVMEPGIPIGVLTSDIHDNWMYMHEALLALPSNAEKVQLVESMMIVLCLDNSAPITCEEIFWGCVDGQWLQLV
ncbi:hypothetical protein H0H87_006648, partial [Tephrocybe sp. NHM501043]